MQERNDNEVIINDENSSINDELRRLKETTVPKGDFEKLKSQYTDLVNQVIDNEKVFREEEQGEVVLNDKQLDELRYSIFNGENSNLEYVEKALVLRKQLIARGEPDPFLPVGRNIAPTYEDTQAAERVADVLEQCVEFAKGDSAVFTNELQRRTNDIKGRR